MDDQPFEVNLIENVTSEHREKIELESRRDIELESKDFNLDEMVNSTIEWASSPSSLDQEPISLTPPPIGTSPSIELKILPKCLKYAYLGDQETFSVIVASNLTNRQEEGLMKILRKHQEAVGWTMTDIKGLSPIIVQHRVHLNEEAKPKREPQRRLNPIIKRSFELK